MNDDNFTLGYVVGALTIIIITFIVLIANGIIKW